MVELVSKIYRPGLKFLRSSKYSYVSASAYYGGCVQVVWTRTSPRDRKQKYLNYPQTNRIACGSVIFQESRGEHNIILVQHDLSGFVVWIILCVRSYYTSAKTPGKAYELDSNRFYKEKKNTIDNLWPPWGNYHNKKPISDVGLHVVAVWPMGTGLNTCWDTHAWRSWTEHTHTHIRFIRRVNNKLECPAPLVTRKRIQKVPTSCTPELSS